MQITETIYQEIKQRLVHVKEEIKELETYYPRHNYEQDLAWLQGRKCELAQMIDILDELKQKEQKNEINS